MMAMGLLCRYGSKNRPMKETTCIRRRRLGLCSTVCVAVSILSFATIMGGRVHAQPLTVRETDTPIARHYAKILDDYSAFIKPRLAGKGDLVKISLAYFDRLGYRLIAVSIRNTVEPKVSRTWKIPGVKLAVLPRITCFVSANGSTVEFYDQGDDYVRIQNFTDGSSGAPELYLSVGITHRWK